MNKTMGTPRKWMLIVAFAALVSAVLVFSLRRPVPSNQRSVSRLSATVAHGVSAGSPIVATPELKVPAVQQRAGYLDWATKYYGAKDAFEFVSAAADKALKGDAAAAYYVAQAVTRCYGRENDPWNTVDSETAFVDKWAKMPKEQFAMEMDRKVMNACLRYVRENAFEGLPERAGGYKDRRFWGKIAYDGGYPLALADHASDEMTALPNGPIYETTNKQKRARAQIDVERVFASGQPEAIFALGNLFDSPSIKSSPDQGIVFRLAACELGYDCSAASPAIDSMLGCATSGTCPSNADIRDAVKQGIGAEAYAASYARAQQLAYAVRSGDPSVVQPLIKFREEIHHQ